MLNQNQYLKNFFDFIIKLLLLIFIFTFSFAVPPTKNNNLYSPDIAKIKQRGVLIVAMTDVDEPPFYMHDKQGDFIGNDVELAKNLAKELGVKVKFDRQYKTFDALVEAATAHKVDLVISLLSKTVTRAQKVKFSEPYIILKQALLVNRVRLAQLERLPVNKNQSLGKILNAPGIKIGVRAASSYVDFAKELFPKATLVELNGQDNMWNAAFDGTVDAGLDDEIGARNLLIKRPEASINIRIVLINDTSDPISIATAWDNTHLLHWINVYLDTSDAKTTATQLFEKYGNTILLQGK